MRGSETSAEVHKHLFVYSFKDFLKENVKTDLLFRKTNQSKALEKAASHDIKTFPRLYSLRSTVELPWCLQPFSRRIPLTILSAPLTVPKGNQ